MSAAAGLFTTLKTAPELVGVIDDRVYPQLMPENQAAFPVVVYSVISAPVAFRSQTSRGPQSVRLQVDVWGQNYLSVDAAADLVIKVLDRSRPAPEIQSSELATFRDDRDPETNLVRRILEFDQVWEVAA